MCGRFVLLADLARVVETFHVEAVHSDYSPLNEVYSGRDVYAVMRDEVNQLVQFRWGPVPYWSKEGATGGKMINARTETLAIKPSFRGASQSNAASLLPMDFTSGKRKAGKAFPIITASNPGNRSVFPVFTTAGGNATAESCALVQLSRPRLTN